MSSALEDVVQGQRPRPAEGTRDAMGSEERTTARKSCANCWDKFRTRVGPTAGKWKSCSLSPARGCSRSGHVSERTTAQSRRVAVSFLLAPAVL